MSTDEINPELPQEPSAMDGTLDQTAPAPTEEVDEFGFTADELVDDEDDDEDGDEDVSPIDEFVDEASVPADGAGSILWRHCRTDRRRTRVQ